MTSNFEHRSISPESELYLDLMKKCLTRSVFQQGYEFVPFPSKKIFAPLRTILASQSYRLVRPTKHKKPEEGLGWPLEAETMIGMKRLDQLQECILEVVKEGVLGDFVETGVWRGGAVIFMRAALKALRVSEKTVWAVDSFQGLPKPDGENYPADARDRLWSQKMLAVSLEEVKSNFQRYGLLDDQVRFLKGFFKDTLPQSPIEQISVLRLDGDLYESTMEALQHLYPKLAKGGYLIVDDYGALGSCKKAVEDYRSANHIVEPIIAVDESCVFWKRAR